MDDSIIAKACHADTRAPLGMSRFGPEDRQQFGQTIRLAMSCIEGNDKPVSSKAMPLDEASIRQRLKILSRDFTSTHADLLELLVRFDDLQGWKTSGAKHCAAWMNLELGISLKLGWEYLRVGRKLRSLPITTSLFRVGSLSWSKIRLIVNVATAENERTLCHASLDASVSGVKQICDGFRWVEEDEAGVDGESQRAFKQWNARSLRWNELSTGNTRIELILPPELAKAFLNSVDHSLNQVSNSVNHGDDAANTVDAEQCNISQRRADAAVLMAETSLQAAGRDIATADRYQVIVSVEASELATPPKRPVVNGAGVIARETARRIACDCSVMTNTTTNGEPTDIGRKSRIWPNAMARAIKDRDQHCQFYGCTQTQNLQIHHLTHWADGGSTSVDNGACLCQKHHTLVHEGGYCIQPVASSEQRLNEQFVLQQHGDDASLFNFEKELRNDKESFNTVRKLSPTSYRFRILDADGNDLRSSPVASSHQTDSHYPISPAHSTRMECAEPLSGFYH